MFYTVYKITNTINGKYYIGKHQTNNLNDGYMGSGKILKHAIKKYGIENFIKEILFVFDNEQEMNDKEKELVVVSEETYNLINGGIGGFNWLNNQYQSNTIYKDYWLSTRITWNKGKKTGSQSIEQRIKKSNSLKEYWSKNTHNRKGKTPWNKGLKGVQTAWNKGRPSIKEKCVYCGKEVDLLNLNRWHNENCREAPDRS